MAMAAPDRPGWEWESGPASDPGLDASVHEALAAKGWERIPPFSAVGDVDGCGFRKEPGDIRGTLVARVVLARAAGPHSGGDPVIFHHVCDEWPDGFHTGATVSLVAEHRDSQGRFWASEADVIEPAAPDAEADARGLGGIDPGEEFT